MDSPVPEAPDRPDFSGRLDFSDFHPQDHFAFDTRCRSLPGGGVRHMRDWWEYRFEHRPDLLVSQLACRLLARHDYRESWHTHRMTPAQKAGLERRPSFYDGRQCWWCGTQDPAPEAAAEPCPNHDALRAEENALLAARRQQALDLHPDRPEA